jgi:hypothetical protein
MIKCSECSKVPDRFSATCTFCKFYNFNGKYGRRILLGPRFVYVNRGWCMLLHKRKDPGDGCKRFHCFNVVP